MQLRKLSQSPLPRATREGSPKTPIESSDGICLRKDRTLELKLLFVISITKIVVGRLLDENIKACF